MDQVTLMNNIAIMTWFHYNNFGTALQAYTLCETIKSFGYHTKIINYHPNCENKRSIKELLKDPAVVDRVTNKLRRAFKVYKNPDIERDIRFDEFRRSYIELTEKCDTLDKLNSLNGLFDAFVSGSDQVWSPIVFNPRYYLDFVDDRNKLIAYAPSIGTSKIQSNLVKERMVELILRFKHLSIRENEGQQIIKRLTGKEAKIVLDPTLLFTKDKYGELLKLNKESAGKEKPYLLCYFLGKNEGNWESAKRISKLLNLDICVIPVHNKDYTRDFKIHKGAGPIEFLNYFSQAGFICTDSYHGTIFSIINQKPFVTYKRFSDKKKYSQNSRIYNILSLLELESQLFQGNDMLSIESGKKIDYRHVEYLLEEKRKLSIDFLKKAIDECAAISLTR